MQLQAGGAPEVLELGGAKLAVHLVGPRVAHPTLPNESADTHHDNIHQNDKQKLKIRFNKNKKKQQKKLGPRDPRHRLGLDAQRILHQKSARETNSKAIS